MIGIGAESGQLLTYQTSVALAALLGSTPVEFPGDHGGFMGAPTEFADACARCSPNPRERPQNAHQIRCVGVLTRTLAVRAVSR